MYIDVGGKEFILSLEDSCLESFQLTFYNYTLDLNSEICMSLEEAATSVNTRRKMNYLTEIEFSIRCIKSQ